MKGFDSEQSGEEIWWNDWFEDEAHECESCNGARLNPVALNVRFRAKSIAEATKKSVTDTRRDFAQLKLQGREQDIARDVLTEISSRLAFLEDVGLGYLALDRSAPTLSGGEAQRIRLAAQLGSNLQGVCYILDEPTIGLHPRDNEILLDTLDKLAERATHCSSSNTMRTRFGVPITCSTWAPVRDRAAARSLRQAQQRSCNERQVH